MLQKCVLIAKELVLGPELLVFGLERRGLRLQGRMIGLQRGMGGLKRAQLVRQLRYLFLQFSQGAFHALHPNKSRRRPQNPNAFFTKKSALIPRTKRSVLEIHPIEQQRERLRTQA